MKKVLVTGFTPFDNEVINPSFEAVKMLPREIAGAQIITLEVPAVFGESLDVVKKVMLKDMPDIVICVGQAGGRAAISVERIAINVDDARIPDNSGQQPLNQPIITNGANAYFTNFPAHQLVTAIQEKGIPAILSNSAGTFVCNHLMYGILHEINTNQQCQNMLGGFIHVPFIPSQTVNKNNQPSMSLTDICEALTIIITTLLIPKQNNEIPKTLGATE